MKRIISLIICISFTAQSIYAFANKAIPLDEGQEAPFSGTLMDEEAVAKILAEREFEKDKCKLEKDYETSKIKAKCDSDKAILQAELDSLNRKHEELMKIKDNESKRLQKIIEDQDNSYSKIFWFTFGIVAGIGATFGAGYALSKI